MEQTVHTPEVYDFRQYDRIWQRVAPTLEPYPTSRPTGEGMLSTMSTVPAEGSNLSVQQESQLPGAQQNPCCMGSAAAEILDVLSGFIEEELENRRYFLALCRQAPSWARQALRDIAADAFAHARRLMAVHYLITGTCYRPNLSCEPITMGCCWCPALRERYHMEACNGLNYARAAEGTTDPCLSKLLMELSADEYRHADMLLTMLERGMTK